MIIRCIHTINVLLILALLSCKKETAVPVPGNNQNNSIGNQQGNYSGNKLAVSAAGNMTSPWVELSADTVYTSSNSITSALVKTIPAGFENKIVSFYLPKGFMLVFAANEDGTGESVLFIAQDSAIKANLPARLQNNISFIRYIGINNPEKKGTASVNDAAVQAFSAQWYYGWSMNKSSFAKQQFVPMTWGKGSCTDDHVKYLVERNDVDHLLSFNEPDNTDQSNVPVDTAIKRYRIMMKTGLRLASPVVTQDQVYGSGKWLSNFMAQAQSLKIRVDCLPVHWYDWGSQTNNAATDSLTAERVFNRFVTYINNVHNAYPLLPVWVTEYNANINRTSEVVHKYFMKLSTEWMNSQAYIERYSYFFPASLPATNPDNTLTAAGMYWKNLPSAKAFSGNVIADAVLIK
nr:glycosyl hydrolase [uncultured Lacibacter sp.]